MQTHKATQGCLRHGRAVPGLALGVALLMAASGVWGQTPRAYFDRDEAYEGDTIVLTIEADGQDGGVRPDLSSLHQDFQVLGTTSGTEVVITNGQRRDTTRWTVSLQPKHTGTFRIPGIALGSERTPPLTLKVSEVPAEVRRAQAEKLFVEMKIDGDGDGISVQQEIPLTVRLYTAVPLREGTLSAPQPADAVVEKLGDDRRYQTRRDGRTYQVTERRYAVFPEKSGTLRIPPVTFRGSVPAQPRTGSRPSSSLPGPFQDDPFFKRFFDDSALDRFFSDSFPVRDPFSLFESVEPITARSRALSLTVKPRPDGYKGAHWLPAESVVIHDSWAENPPSLRAGEPATRTLTIEAKGLAASQIPELDLPEVAGLRTYPEQTQRETRVDGKEVVGTSRQRVAIIPDHAGEIAVPELKVSWWDTTAKRERVAVVPGRKLTVAAGSGVSPARAASAAAALPPRPVAEKASREAGKSAPPLPAAREVQGPWPWIAGLLAVALAATLLIRRRYPAPPSGGRSKQADRDGLAAPTGPGPGLAKRHLREACEGNDAKAAARALVAWAAAEWPDRAPPSLSALADRLKTGGEVVRELEQTLYGPGSAPWQGRPLWEALREGLQERQGPRQSPEPPLPPLYPQQA